MTSSTFPLSPSARNIFPLLVEGFVRHLRGEELRDRLGLEGGRLRGETGVEEQRGVIGAFPHEAKPLLSPSLCPSDEGLGNK